jgi:hypothetical protein
MRNHKPQDHQPELLNSHVLSNIIHSDRGPSAPRKKSQPKPSQINTRQINLHSNDLSKRSSMQLTSLSPQYKKGSTYQMFLGHPKSTTNRYSSNFNSFTNQPEEFSVSRSIKRQPSTQRSKSRYNYAPKNGDLDDIKVNLRKIFEFYVSYGERMNLKYMRSNKFLKLMGDVDIPLDKTTLDLLFVVEMKHRSNMDFEKFLNLLPKLAMLVYQDSAKQPKEALLDLLSTYFTPLYERIMQSTHIGSAQKLLKDGVDPDSLDLIWQVQDILKKVYSFHFPEEYYKEDDYSHLDILKNISQTKFFKFCREFNIIPYMIPKGKGLAIFNDIIDVPLSNLYKLNILEDKGEDAGWIWTFSRFLFFLLKINEITFVESDIYNAQGSIAGSPSENLTLILNQFQGSQGFTKFRQTLGANYSMISLCPSNSLSSLKKSFQSIGMISQSERKNSLDRSNSILKNSTIRS